MKQCPFCNKTYDDTWKICLYDNTDLIDPSSKEFDINKKTESIKKNGDGGQILFVIGMLSIPLAAPFYQGMALTIAIKAGLRQMSGTDGTTIGMGIGIGLFGAVISFGCMIAGYILLRDKGFKKLANKYGLIAATLVLAFFLLVLKRGI